jgi:uroporphyrinogen-III decarboxylase
MTHRERMLAAIRGKQVDRIPWAPRMDLWYIANRAKGELSERFVGKNMVELAGELNVASHAVRADFTNPRTPEHLILRGLGLDLHHDYPFKINVLDLPVKFQHDEENFFTTIKTPAGEVITHTYLTGKMLRNGISLFFIKSYAIESKDDLEAVAQVFDLLEVVPTPEAHAEFQKRVADQGVAVAAGLYGASPMHLILHDLMPTEQFFISYLEERDALYKLANRMEPFFETVLDAVLRCDAEIIYWGSNYDQNITWPPFFKDEIAPWLKKVSKRVHDAGKLLLTHTDGENKALLPLYPSCEFDIAESVCPHPMTANTLKEIREGMGSKTTVWGGIPSIALLDSIMDDNRFEAYLDEMFSELGTGERLILGVSDNVPPEANLSRFEKIEQKIKAFGPVQPGKPNK